MENNQKKLEPIEVMKNLENEIYESLGKDFKLQELCSVVRNTFITQEYLNLIGGGYKFGNSKRIEMHEFNLISLYVEKFCELNFNKKFNLFADHVFGFIVIDTNSIESNLTIKAIQFEIGHVIGFKGKHILALKEKIKNETGIEIKNIRVIEDKG